MMPPADQTVSRFIAWTQALVNTMDKRDPGFLEDFYEELDRLTDKVEVSYLEAMLKED